MASARLASDCPSARLASGVAWVLVAASGTLAAGRTGADSGSAFEGGRTLAAAWAARMDAVAVAAGGRVVEAPEPALPCYSAPETVQGQELVAGFRKVRNAPALAAGKRVRLRKRGRGAQWWGFLSSVSTPLRSRVVVISGATGEQLAALSRFVGQQMRLS